MLNRWLDKAPANLPKWLEAPAFAVFLVLAFAWSRGAAVLVPLVVVATFFLTPTPFRVIGIGIGVYLAILLAAAAGGLIYELIGRRLRRLPKIGGFLGGSVSAIPYALVSTWVVLGVDKSAWSPAEFRAHGGWFVSGFIALVIGGTLAYAWHTQHHVDPEEDDKLTNDDDADGSLGTTRRAE